MREIKFRAWSKKKKKMIYNWQDTTNVESFGFNGNGYFEIMQYTGLKDKNGKEIYEGDILGVSGGSGVFWEVNWDNTKTDLPVGFVFGSFGMRSNIPQYLHPSIDRLEIIGNIYENPELLNGDT